MATVSTLVVALTAQTTDFERGLKSVEKSLDRTASRIESLGASMTAGLTAPLAALAGAATKLSMDFNEPFDKMQAVLDLSAKEADGLRESVLKLAGQTAQSPKELGEALYEVEAAGVRGGAAIDVLKASAEAAAIGLGNAKNIASFLSAELNAYGPHALSAAQATSVLIEAARVGRLNIDELVGSVGSIMPIAAQAGVSFDQIAAAVASMTRSGMEAGQATTSLRTVLQTIEKPSASVQKALAMVGLSAASLKEELASKGLLATLQTLKTAVEGNDEALAQIFPSARTFAGVLSLLGDNSQATERIFQQMAGTTTNTLATAFRKAASDDSFQFHQALVKIQTALIRLGNDILPIIVPLVERFTKTVGDLTDRFERMDAGSKDLAFVFLTIVASMGPLLLAFSTLYSSAATAVGAFRLLIGMTGLASLFSAVGAAVSGLGAAMLELVGYFSAFGVAETIAGVVLPALAGSALLAGVMVAAAAYLWISKWQELKTDMGVIVDFISEKLSSLNRATHGFLNALYFAMNPALALLVQMKPAIQTALGEAAEVATKAGTDLKDGFLGQVDSMEKGLGDVFSRMVAKAKGMATGLVGSVQGIGTGAPPGDSGAANYVKTGPPLPPDYEQRIRAATSVWVVLGETMAQQGSAMNATLMAFRENALDAANNFKSAVKGMVSATQQSMGAMTAAFARGQINLIQFTHQMVEAIVKLIAKILILKALTAAGMGGPFAAGFIGGMFAEGGRPPMGKVSIVGEKGPELFVPDTAGTIIPNSSLGGGGGGGIHIEQTVQITGMDLGSQDAARRLAVSLKEIMRSGAAEGVALAGQTAQLAKKNAGRAI